MIAIIDSGGANIASVRFALERLGVDGQLTQVAPVDRLDAEVGPLAQQALVAVRLPRDVQHIHSQHALCHLG